MSSPHPRNPIDRAFVAGTVQRHQVHEDPRFGRRSRRVKHRARAYVEWDSD